MPRPPLYDFERARSQAATLGNVVQTEPELIQAARAGDLSRIRMALAAAADVNEACTYTTSIDRDLYEGTHTALLVALENGHEDVAILLLDHGANPDAADAFDGTRPLHEAVKRGLARAVDRLLAAGGQAAPRMLFDAAYRNLPDIAARLLDAGVDLDAGGPDASALYAAAWGGHAVMIEWLLARGANLAAAGAGALRAAANAGRTDAVRVLITRGVPVDSADADGWTPLLMAAWQGQTEAVRVLLAAGADAAHRDGAGKTALDWAREGKRDAVIAVLT